MHCPRCSDPSPRVIIKKFERKDYGHLFCSKCAISFDSNVNEIAEDFSQVDDARIKLLSGDDYRRYFVEASDITDGTDDIYTAFNWDSQDELKQGIITHITKQIDEKYSVNDEFTVLDIGCGDGFTTSLLSQIYTNATFVAIDPSPAINNLRGRERIRAFQSILQNIDFGDETFDVIQIIGNLMLHADPFDTLMVTKHLMADEGLLIFDFKNVNSSSRVLVRKMGFLSNQTVYRKRFIQRHFANMRYGLSKEYMFEFCERIGLQVKGVYSKPPRLLEFGNKSKYTQGLSGLVWRLLNNVDQSRDEMSWVQFTCVKKR